MNKINWFEYSGILGGQRGMEINFKTDIIEYHNGKEDSIKGNEKEVLWVLNKNIESVEKKISKLSHRLNLEKIERRVINGGYAELSPLSEVGKERYREKIKKLSEELDFYFTKREEYI